MVHARVIHKANGNPAGWPATSKLQLVALATCSSWPAEGPGVEGERGRGAPLCTGVVVWCTTFLFTSTNAWDAHVS